MSPELPVPTWLIILVWLIVGLYFLGRWEGWWEHLANKFRKPKPESPHAAWCGNYQCSGDCLTQEERDNYE